MKCQPWSTVPLKSTLRRVFFILTDDLIIQSFQKSHFGPTSFFHLKHSKATEPQIKQVGFYFFFFFFKSSGGKKQQQQQIPERSGISWPNPAALAHSQFFFVAGSERLSGVVSAHTQRTMFGAMQYLHSRRAALPAASHGSLSRYVLVSI